MAENIDSDFVLKGQIVDGRVVLDPYSFESADSETMNLADPGDSFVAVNAPFDPESESVELELELVEA